MDHLELVNIHTLQEVLDLYDAVLTFLENNPDATSGPGWKRSVYPTEAEARAGLEQGSLYLLRDEATGRAAATVILDHIQPAAYANAAWAIAAPPSQVMVVHTFMTDPHLRGRGFGRRVLVAAHRLAREAGCLCMRLDTYAGNLPACALYEGMGYQSAGQIDLGFGQYGLHWYQTYELLL
ncbi:MAG: GNAT family N-acetyltransferase [Clostridia bacterium]|nr:GNAT family N-acetyltransferase [Clostridia bacterium]